MKNPFIFGTVAVDESFTDREQETIEINSVLNSMNHLVLISPRRYGKTSLIHKVTGALDRPVIYLDLQLVVDANDMAAELLRRVLKYHKWENIKRRISEFRIVPSVELNPATDNLNVSFFPVSNKKFTPVTDVLDLIDNTANKKKKPIVVFDEFQEANGLDPALLKQMRSAMQMHHNVNYVFLGSMESMMREIFETKKSPFYHFGHMMTLGRISSNDFLSFLTMNFNKISDDSDKISADILACTDCHPYYTQQLAYYCFDRLDKNKYDKDMVQTVIESITNVHGNDFGRLWNTLSKTDKKVLLNLALGKSSTSIDEPTSTVYSALVRLAARGYLIKNTVYEFDDPFFRKWIIDRRAV